MSKSPVSILYEVSRKRRLYISMHKIFCCGKPPNFCYMAKCCNICKFGTGLSIKSAKHDAAKQLLEKMVELHLCARDESIDQIHEKYRSDQIQKMNLVATVHNFAKRNNLPKPQYTEPVKCGKDHEAKFYVRCHIGTISASGSGNTKKEARREASKQILSQFENISQDLFLTSLGSSLANKLGFPLPNSIEYTLKIIFEKANITYNDIQYDLLERDMTTLETIFNKMDLDVIRHTIGAKEHTIICFLALNSEPKFVMAQWGKNSKEALSKLVSKMFHLIDQVIE